MRYRRKALLAGFALTAQFAVGAVTATMAHAATGPADDRQLSSPTSWWTYTNASPATISSKLSANHARLTGLTADSATTFTATMVSNSGAYASSYWWYYGLTASQVSSDLSTNHARLISIDAYSTTSGTRFAVVMVPNSGTNAKSFWWYYNVTTSQISSALSTNHARLIQLSPYAGSSDHYVAIMVDNTGTNATSWWWYYHASTATVSSHLSTNKAHLIDLSHNSDGTFNVVMYSGTSVRWYWYYGQNLTTAVNRALQQGERIIDVAHYGSSYAVISTRNTNSLSETLWNVIAPTMPATGYGKYGFYLKQVGGSTLAGVQQSVGYEPASALKVLYHAKSIHEESLGNTTDSTVITYHYDTTDPTNQGICPDDFATTSTTNLKNADQQMMWNSDNRMTRGILEKYGKTAMLNYASTLGLTSTQINHNIGCPTDSTHNVTTLVDLGKVYEAYQNNTITSSSTWKAQFKSRMLNESNYSGFRTSICPIVQQEATKLGISSSVATTFCNSLTWIAKGGSYDYGVGYPRTVSYDGVSLTGVPYKTNGTTTPKYFVFGEYIDGTNLTSDAQRTAINNARSKEYQEAMRPYIHAALATWG